MHMTATIIIVLLPSAIASAIALLIGYLHRKQMRQIELFRIDPKAGLLPRPSPPVAFIKRNWFHILYGGPVLSLVWLYSWHAPASFSTTIYIALNFATMTLIAAINFAAKFDERIFDLIMMDVKTSQTINLEIANALKALSERIKILELRLPTD